MLIERHEFLDPEGAKPIISGVTAFGNLVFLKGVAADPAGDISVRVGRPMSWSRRLPLPGPAGVRDLAASKQGIGGANDDHPGTTSLSAVEVLTRHALAMWTTECPIAVSDPYFKGRRSSTGTLEALEAALKVSSHRPSPR